MWAMAQGTGMNIVDEHGEAVGRRDTEWIRTVLSFMQDDAAVWAAPAMESFAERVVPFGGQWVRFHDDFRARFETVDEATDAKEKLRALWQNTSSVPEYAAQFKQLMARTRYSLVDLRDRFYKHLAVRIKDALVNTDRRIGTFDELVLVATDIDTRMRQRRAEKEREKPRTSTLPSFTTAPVQSSSTAAPAVDPSVMDVDATRMRDEFIRRMRGRCFGCGSSSHTKKDGGHERDLCAHCKRVGHREVVCMEKFMKRPKKQQVAATEEEDSLIDGLSDVSSIADSLDGSEIAEIAATGVSVPVAIPQNVLAQVLEQQKALMEQIVALREQDF
jgi:hypothetical protein